jgi:phosphoribosyl 1,2-cyclic phosphate phosphodiesterase
MSFSKKNAPLEGRSVYDVGKGPELVSELRPKCTVFTHLRHGVDLRTPLPDGITFARDGLQLDLP